MSENPDYSSEVTSLDRPSVGARMPDVRVLSVADGFRRAMFPLLVGAGILVAVGSSIVLDFLDESSVASFEAKEDIDGGLDTDEAQKTALPSVEGGTLDERDVTNTQQK